MAEDAVGAAWEPVTTRQPPVAGSSVWVPTETLDVDYGAYQRNDAEAVRNVATLDRDWPSVAEDFVRSDVDWEDADRRSIEAAVAVLPADMLEIADAYDHAEGSPKPYAAMVRAHVLRAAKGWTHETSLHRYFREQPFLAPKLGFSGIPDQSTLWRAWNRRFTDAVREAIEAAAERIVTIAREHGLAVPDPAFKPRDTDAESDRSERRLTRQKTREVWNAVRPLVEDAFSLQREEGRIPESAFWELHSFLGLRTNAFTTSGANAFRLESTRDRTPSGATQRHWLTDIDHRDARRMFQEVARTLVARARSNDELSRDVTAAIDITKGPPWTGEIERDEHGNSVEEWRLGYKKETHHQWAVIQVVGLDVPLVLDAVPVRRGDERSSLVDTLLETATGILDTLDLVVMDREFDGAAVKTVCEEHGVHYLNPSRVQSSTDHDSVIREMAANDEVYRVTEDRKVTSANSRKAIYIPSRNDEFGHLPDEVSEADEEPSDIRQEMLDEWELEEDDLAEGPSPFDSLLDDIRAEEDLAAPGSEFYYVPFETNVDLEVSADGVARDHQVARLMREYSHRWGIENGFRQIKRFLPRTTSPDPEYRYFNFLWACLLYNTWRLVDTLVKQSLEDDPDYTPRVTAQEFLTLTKDWSGGLDPPAV